ncbi:MAG TPA: HAD-IA family hydrolase [bacterium]|nr:HAD-IA family hydrolase [bacterium]
MPESFWLTKALLFDFDWVIAESKNPNYNKKDYEDPTPLTALKDCFRTLRSYEIRLSLTSNRRNSEIVPVLHQLNLAEDFDNIRCSDDVKEMKPSPEMHQLSMDMLGVKPWRAVAFETTEEGVQAAKAAGIFCVGMPPGVDGQADMKMTSFLDSPLIHVLEKIDRIKRAGLAKG